MKELSIEEKAKAYDEAKLRMSRAFNDNRCSISFMDEIFPELKESDNEKIKSAAFHAVATVNKYSKCFDEVSKDTVLVWLEKQGEHANFLNKIQIGDEVTRNEDGVLVNLSQLNRVAKKQTEQKLYVNDNAKEMFIKALERVEEQNNKGYKLTDCDKNSWWEDFKAYTSCTIEQKPAEWSEEDEEIHRKCICAMRASACGFPEEEKFVEQVDNWLKSLKERYVWKPSDEQMDALHYVTNFDYGGHKATLVSLYEQLKKLKDEK